MINTKEELANALKQLSHEKSFDKISISDITQKCELNRQTFYYHFQDKYECLEWIYRNDCLQPLTTEINYNNWEKKIEKMLYIMSNDKTFYMNSIKDNPRIFMNLFQSITMDFFKNMIDEYEEKRKNVILDNRFISGFLTMGILGMTMEWVAKGMKISPDILADQFKIMGKKMREMGEYK